MFKTRRMYPRSLAAFPVLLAIIVGIPIFVHATDKGRIVRCLVFPVRTHS
jgi:hypothetical protein